MSFFLFFCFLFENTATLLFPAGKMKLRKCSRKMPLSENTRDHILPDKIKKDNTDFVCNNLHLQRPIHNPKNLTFNKGKFI